ncbi:MAG: hypothetical protein AB7V77_05205 [Candidatus Woesearchaeota archaeon]
MQIKKKLKDREGRELEFLCGYDEKLDYVFMCVYFKEKLIFDNLSLKNALEIKDFSYYKEIALKKYGVFLDEIEIEISDFLDRYFHQDRPTNKIYCEVIKSISKTENKCLKAKDLDNLPQTKHFKEELFKLHEVRRTIEKIDIQG